MGDPPDHGSVTCGRVGVQFTLATASYRSSDYPGWFYFFVENIDSLAAGYEQRGIEFTQSLGTREHGMREFEIRSEEHTSELQSLMRSSYAVFCLKKKKT